MTLATVLLMCGVLGLVGFVGVLITVAAGARRPPKMEMHDERKAMLIDAQRRADGR